ncbi:MAG: hypothetical protein OEV42_18730 [Deltaproteobacteria bacterium]|nr:hypothetical protein [Deltaproteobacteria bacterium]
MGKSFKDRILDEIGDQKPTPWGLSIGLNEGAINRIFKQNVIPRAEHLMTISKALGVSVNWLLTGEELYSNRIIDGSEISATNKKLIDLFNVLPPDSIEGLVSILDSYVGALKDEEARKAFDSFKKSFKKEIKKTG